MTTENTEWYLSATVGFNIVEVQDYCTYNIHVAVKVHEQD